MHFFVGIQTSTDYETTGNVFPQAGFALADNDFETYDIVQRNLGYRAFTIDNKPVFRLDKKAILTDVLSHSLGGRALLVNENFRDHLTGFKLEHIRFLPVTVIDRSKKEHAYFLMYPVRDMTYEIDYPGTIFQVSEINGSEVSRFKVNSAKEYSHRTIRIVGMEIWPVDGVLKLKTKVDIDDLLVFGLILGRLSFFASEALAAHLENTKLTGFDITRVRLEIL